MALLSVYEGIWRNVPWSFGLRNNKGGVQLPGGVFAGKSCTRVYIL